MMYPYHACMWSLTEIDIVSTVGRILQVESLADVDPNSEDRTGEDSEMDKNLEICRLEKRDFDDKESRISYRISQLQ
jgi:hypothetical protein